MTPGPVPLDRARRLIDESGSPGVQAPVAAQAPQVTSLGSTGGRDRPHKLANCSVETFQQDGHATALKIKQ